MKKRNVFIGFLSLFSILLLAACSSNETGKETNENTTSEQFTMPDIISMTAYDVGSTGYIQGAAIATEMKEAENKTLRIIPSGTDIARLSPVKSGDVHFAMTGAGAYIAQEGMYDFATYEWGPQPIRMVWMGLSDTGVSMVVTEESGMKTPSDLKGKRVQYVPGAPAINVPIEAFLAYGDLTWDDVEKVEFPSNGAALSGLTDGLVDAVFAFNDTQFFIEQTSTKEGAYQLRLPAEEKEAWERFHEIWPVIVPHKATAGEGATPEKPIDVGIYPYPIVATYKDLNPELAYNMSKMIGDNFEGFKDAHPSLTGWDPERQIVDWQIPWHEGSVKYLKEIGLWTEEAEAHNIELIERQDALIKDFDKVVGEATDQGISAADFSAFWEEKRSEILNNLQ